MKLLLILLGILALVARGEPATPPGELARQGLFAAAAGSYEQQAAAQLARRESTAAVKSYLNAASCLKMTGDLGQATANVAKARRAGGETAPLPPALDLRIKALDGSIRALGKKPREAITPLTDAKHLAKQLDAHAILAEIHNDLGIAHASNRDYQLALSSFAAAESLARQTKQGGLALRAQQNHLIAAYQQCRLLEEELVQIDELDGFAGPDRLANHRTSADRFTRALNRAIHTLNGAPDDNLHVFFATSAGIAAVRHGLGESGFNILHGALASARRLGDPTLERSCLLALADLYLDHSRPDDARTLLQEARGIRRAPDPVQQATLELLTARVHATRPGDSDKSLNAINRAVNAVEAIRSDLARTQGISDLGRSFRQRAGLPYLLLADHHLRNPEATSDDFAAARNAIEKFKRWELEDFYRDDCVNLSLQSRRRLDKIDDPSVGVLYVIPLPGRTEILLQTTRGTTRWTSNLTGPELSRLARIFRHQLEGDIGTSSYAKTADQLYRELISPGRPTLRAHGIKHLVFIPDGALGGIPLAALRNPDTRRFLIEDYSLSIAPSLAMTPGDRSARQAPLAILAGSSRFSPPFDPLPAVAQEIKTLQQLYSEPRVRFNPGFTLAHLTDDMETSDASVIHIATHGEFGGTADQTFLLAHNNRKITLDDLERLIRPKKFRGQPVDLLCLSACQTAAGDDRAALGFAGVAVKSGSRSVAATLWHVNDTAASRIATNFHRHYLAGMSKAKALRKAQLDELHAHNTHPNFWAPFVLIGDWN